MGGTRRPEGDRPDPVHRVRSRYPHQTVRTSARLGSTCLYVGPCQFAVVMCRVSKLELKGGLQRIPACLELTQPPVVFFLCLGDDGVDDCGPRDCGVMAIICSSLRW
ncbi:hypothetical protein OPV22_023435 [Ensete ventricosum]|uniref:Uncharacterized protein n=1 Tax=Ensete ventricosum TaxID=4639 RepID=A0AAV8QS13_ENSVE|nr:hypothetical protein OPV22_023435 [Ensete ventricosum]